MNDRRRFLHILGATTAAAALPACGGSDSTSGTTGTGGAGGGGAGGAGGAGGGASTATSSSTASSSSATSSTGTGGMCDEAQIGELVGAPSDFASAGLHLLPGTKILIGRDDKGLYALTSVCTHDSCDMDGKKASGSAIGVVSATGITCTCHGSKFDNFGAVVKGPAEKPLKAYAMTLCEGKIYVDTTSTVPVTQRLVP